MLALRINLEVLSDTLSSLLKYCKTASVKEKKKRGEGIKNRFLQEEAKT